MSDVKWHDHTVSGQWDLPLPMGRVLDRPVRPQIDRGPFAITVDFRTVPWTFMARGAGWWMQYKLDGDVWTLGTAWDLDPPT